MANYDKATQDFINDVAASAPQPSVEQGQKNQRLIRSVIKAVSNPKQAPSLVAKQLTRNFFEKDASEVSQFKPLKIYNDLMSDFKKEWFDWDADTLREEFPDQEEVVYSMVQALQTIVKTNFPYEMWHVFENVGHAINGNPVMINHVTPLEIDECALLVKVIDSIRPKLDETEEICSYIAACAMDAGLVLLPPTIFDSMCQAKLDELNLDIAIKEQTLKALKSGKIPDEVVQLQIDRIKNILDYVQESLGA